MREAHDCPLCLPIPADALWSDSRCFVIRAELPGVGGYCRVVWRAHVSEMTDLTQGDRHHLLDVVLAVETGLRLLCGPEKMNLASLGNIVPHLHWHVIPRFLDDPFFPDSIWSPAKREAPDRKPLDYSHLSAQLVQKLGA